MKIINKIILSFSCVFLLSSPVMASRIIIEGKAEGTQIDVSSSLNAFEALGSENIAIRDNAIATIIRNPELYNPTVFYKLAEILFLQGKKDDAMFWFYSGQLRARYDANRCADETARSAVSVLNENYGQQINKYAFEDLDKFEKIMTKVIEFDKNTKHLYDQRWINLHGMGAMMDELGDKKAQSRIRSLPIDEWAKISEKTRNEYFEGFKDAMKQIRGDKK
ncbi:MAG: hypothetical protein LCH83_08700 [Proteobacteria bacterium]|nr:hypothetical protein [Pseudomonadota bacterium]